MAGVGRSAKATVGLQRAPAGSEPGTAHSLGIWKPGNLETWRHGRPRRAAARQVRRFSGLQNSTPSGRQRVDGQRSWVRSGPAPRLRRAPPEQAVEAGAADLGALPGARAGMRSQIRTVILPRKWVQRSRVPVAAAAPKGMTIGLSGVSPTTRLVSLLPSGESSESPLTVAVRRTTR